MTNFTNLVPLIKEMSKERGQLCFVSNSASVSKAILIAFKKESIFVQFFFLDNNTKIRQGYFQIVDAVKEFQIISNLKNNL